VFSKVLNAQFLITLNFGDLRRGADNLKATFKEFLGGFSDLNSIKRQIINATSVMITAVPRGRDLESVIEAYRNTPNDIGDELREFNAELKKEIIEKGRVFIFHEAVEGKVYDSKHNILSSIISKGQFWRRELSKNKKEVTMNNINLSLVKYINESQSSFKSECNAFEKFYKENVLSSFKGF
jgi:hypothetical protein